MSFKKLFVTVVNQRMDWYDYGNMRRKWFRQNDVTLRKICQDFSRYEPSVFSLDNYSSPIESQQKDNNGIVNLLTHSP